MNDFQGDPRAVDQASLISIGNAVKGYLVVLKRRRPLPSDRLQKFGSLRLKLAPLLRPGGFPEGTVLFFSHEEVSLIQEAIAGFISMTQRVVEPSRQRDEALQELSALGQYLAHSGKRHMND